MREEILSLLNEAFPQIDFTESNTMVEDEILDSLTIVEMISCLSMEFEVHIPYEEIIPDNFNSLDSIVSLVERLKK